ncbi:MAG: hypothetical protein ACYTFQ_32195 [Planctomycetota bacterium]
MNNTIRGFWQHTNGKIYAVECDTVGNIIGAAIIGWLTEAVAQRKLRRLSPAAYR